MELQRQLEFMDIARGFLLRSLEGVTGSQWTEIPEGMSNNILWNAAHLAATQGRLLYGLSGLPVPVPERLGELAMRGTSPKDWADAPDPVEVVDWLKRLNLQVAEDAQAGRFVNFTAYTLANGMRVETLSDALAFQVFHEGIHVGVIMALKKLVA